MEAGVPSVEERARSETLTVISNHREANCVLRTDAICVIVDARCRIAFPGARAIANRSRWRLETLPDVALNDMAVSYFSYASERARTLRREPAGKVPG